MLRIHVFRCLLVGCATMLPVAARAQVTGTAAARTGPLIMVDGVVLQGGTASDRQAVLRILGPAIESIEVIKGPTAVQRFGDAAVDGAVLIRLKSELARDTAIVTPRIDAFLWIVDGVIVPRAVLSVLRPEDIDRIEVLKGDAAAQEFGERGLDGVIRITTRKRQLH